MGFLTAGSLVFLNETVAEEKLPDEMQKIMQASKYEHAFWGLYVKDLQTDKILYDINSNKLFSPASTTKLFSVGALLHTFGPDHRFKTPVYAAGEISNGKLTGDLILVGQGDLTLGGRESAKDKIAYTKLDHINANEVPGVILTPQDPLHGLNELARQISDKGIKEIEGSVIIDDSLFETAQKRGMVISPIMINENFIDLSFNPTQIGQKADVVWRPQVPGYRVENQVVTAAKDEALTIEVSSDTLGHVITVKGVIPLNQKNVVRTFSIKDPKTFAQAAFVQALEKTGIKLSLSEKQTADAKSKQPIALWTSPPLSEYAKLILKVSHNLGADLIPLLLAVHHGGKTFDEGMALLGDFATEEVKLSPESFVFIDGAGGNENRLTPQADIQLLEYFKRQPPEVFSAFFDALPILGVDGSLEDFAKHSPGAGKVRAKTGTGAAFNLATKKFFLITQALAGYIEGKNGHLLAYALIVNNAAMPSIEDVFAIFEDESQLSSLIYQTSSP
jgi:D-alanyl-D-alanine carboxypeptidase/D-alanyl-D-alanine-endopeptidase (penicillin-binding protein 4)